MYFGAASRVHVTQGFRCVTCRSGGDPLQPLDPHVNPAHHRFLEFALRRQYLAHELIIQARGPPGALGAALSFLASVLAAVSIGGGRADPPVSPAPAAGGAGSTAGAVRAPGGGYGSGREFSLTQALDVARGSGRPLLSVNFRRPAPARAPA